MGTLCTAHRLLLLPALLGSFVQCAGSAPTADGATSADSSVPTAGIVAGSAGHADTTGEGQGPPAPGPVPANRCRGFGLVLEVRESELPPSAREALPVDAEADIVVVVFDLTGSEPVLAAELADLCPAPGRMEVASRRGIAEVLSGIPAVAMLELRGDTTTRTWWLHTIESAETPERNPQ